MNPAIQIVAIAGSIAVMLIVFEQIRRRRLREEYSFAWFLAGAVLILLSVWRDGLHRLAALVGIDYPPSFLLLAAIVLGFIIALHFSVSLSRLSDQNKRLAQEVAILRQGLDNLTRSSETVEANRGVQITGEHSGRRAPTAAGEAM